MADDGPAAPCGAGGAAPRRPVPAVVWLLWFDGWTHATELHHRCLESWRLFNPGWDVRAISRADIPGLLGDLFPEYERLRVAMNPLEKWGGFWIPPAAESDFLRLLLLTLYGGAWADSTMLCRRPLDEWLPSAAASGFFAFSPESLDEGLPVMSSFLASTAVHAITASWLRRVTDHWSASSATRPDLGFFWLHKIFGEMVEEGAAGDAGARDAWRAVPKVTGEYGARGPHFFVKYSERLRPPPTSELLASIRDDWETPMQKLTNHEVKLADVGPDSCYWVLLEETRRRARGRLAGGGVGSTLAALCAAPRHAVLRRLLELGADVGCH